MRRAAARLVAVALVAHAATAAGAPLSPAAFRDRYAAAVAAAGVPTTVIDERTFAGRIGNGDDVRISIDNAYAEYRRDPAALDAILRRFAGVLTAPSSAETIDQLIVIVRPADYLARSFAPGASLASFLPSRPLGGDVAEFLAVDAADSIRTATPADLARWRIDVAAAWVRAVANVKVRMGELAMGKLEGRDDGASAIGAASGLAPSLLAEPELCDAAHPDGVAGQVVLVYSRDALLFGVPSDAAMMAAFWRTATAAIAAGTSLSTTPLVCRDGRWTVAAAPRPARTPR